MAVHRQPLERSITMRMAARILGTMAVCGAALVVGAIAWCQDRYPTYVHRYRLTISIEIDAKVHTGSSVIEIAYVGQPNIPGVGSFLPHVRGQAVYIDLAERGAVIGALHPGMIQNGSSSATFLAMEAYGVTGGYDAYRVIAQQSGRRNLARNNMPLLIWLPNPADAGSAQVFTTEQIPTLFGPTARLFEAYVEITTDPIEINLPTKLPWYRDLAAAQKSRATVSRPNEFQPVHNMFVGEGL